MEDEMQTGVGYGAGLSDCIDWKRNVKIFSLKFFKKKRKRLKKHIFILTELQLKALTAVNEPLSPSTSSFYEATQD